MKNLQQAADDVGVIAETIETLHKLLDKFHADHGPELYGRVERAWPDASRIAAPRALYSLESQLTPPEL
jgi:hypothetical protein